jgi:diguanylate cyclase (GGDEF)-like protein
MLDRNMQTGIRILVVDDEESIRNILSQILTDAGHEVTAAGSGEEALEIFRKEHFPLVISDIRLGGMDGIDLLTEVKRLDPDVQVLMITSYASMETAIMALRTGAYDYLIKPFEDLDLITAAVDRAIEKIRFIIENEVLVENLKRNKEELERLNEVLREMAIRDGLTGLYNHRFFYEALWKEIDRSTRHGHVFSLIFIDVDFFKRYNDTYGHPEGDKVLRDLAEIFKKRLRKTDLIARYGGEEFVMLLPETHRDIARRVAEEIRKRVEEHPFEGEEVQPLGKVTVSMGLAVFPGDGSDGDSLIKSADAALYEAKHSGRNRVC